LAHRKRQLFASRDGIFIEIDNALVPKTAGNALHVPGRPKGQ
jgi:hypothetical protein